MADKQKAQVHKELAEVLLAFIDGKIGQDADEILSRIKELLISYTEI